MISENEAPRCVQQLRRERRMKVLLSGEIRFGGAASACRVHDISRGGACLEVARPPAIGGRVEFVRGVLAARGTVAWVRGKRFGVSFAEPIRATDLLVQMSQSRQALEPALRPGGATSPSPSR